MQKVDQQIVQVVLVGLLVGLHVVDGAVLLHLEPRAGPHLSLHQQHQLPPRLRLQVTIKKETNFSYFEVFFGKVPKNYISFTATSHASPISTSRRTT